ncbi:MAG: hypothetical protein ACXV49_00530 [Halobacteriota archaeon]
MPETGPKNAEQLHDAVVKKAAETILKKYKVVMNIAGNKVASIGDVYPDLLAYEVFSVKPFLASEIPFLVGVVETEDVISQKLLDKWAHLKKLDVDRIILILPEQVRHDADVLQRDLGPKFELHFFDSELHIS